MPILLGSDRSTTINIPSVTVVQVSNQYDIAGTPPDTVIFTPQVIMDPPVPTPTPSPSGNTKVYFPPAAVDPPKGSGSRAGQILGAVAYSRKVSSYATQAGDWGANNADTGYLGGWTLMLGAWNNMNMPALGGLGNTAYCFNSGTFSSTYLPSGATYTFTGAPDTDLYFKHSDPFHVDLSKLRLTFSGLSGVVSVEIAYLYPDSDRGQAKFRWYSVGSGDVLDLLTSDYYSAYGAAPIARSAPVQTFDNHSVKLDYIRVYANSGSYTVTNIEWFGV